MTQTCICDWEGYWQIQNGNMTLALHCDHSHKNFSRFEPAMSGHPGILIQNCLSKRQAIRTPAALPHTAHRLVQACWGPFFFAHTTYMGSVFPKYPPSVGLGEMSLAAGSVQPPGTE